MKPSLAENRKIMQRALPSEDILSFRFCTKSKIECELFFADGIVDKELMGTLVIRPLSQYEGKAEEKALFEALSFPELRCEKAEEALISAVLEGNPVLFADGVSSGFVLGTKKAPQRAVTEPQTELVTKGPRAGFIEDIKTNMGQIRLRFKTPNLRFETLQIGKQSNTSVSLCYLAGIAKEGVIEEVKRRILSADIDAVPDSSYVSRFLCPGRPSLFKQVNTTEKPDIFCARIAEGRVGILVDGSPVALTVPYLIIEEFQSPEDYFVNPYRATFLRILRIGVLLLAIFLPALYVAAQLFKMQLIPLSLLLTIASSIQGLPLSPSLEVFVTLMVLEILNEAAIRMPKYVGLALSVVGALVLGETAVNAGILSTPAVILIAFSGIGLYTVPELFETTSLLRLIALIVAGSIGIYGIVLFALFLVIYLVGEDRYGSPILAPFAPIVENDWKDSLVKFSMKKLKERPHSLGSANQTRLKEETDGTQR